MKNSYVPMASCPKVSYNEILLDSALVFATL